MSSSATDPLRQKSSKFDLYTMLSSTNIVSKREEIIYDFQSFVAEFGGALGLFLGFSIIMIWDGIKTVFDYLIKLHTPKVEVDNMQCDQ